MRQIIFKEVIICYENGWSGSADLVVGVLLPDLLLRFVLGLYQEESIDDQRREGPEREEGEEKSRVPTEHVFFYDREERDHERAGCPVENSRDWQFVWLHAFGQIDPADRAN